MNISAVRITVLKIIFFTALGIVLAVLNGCSSVPKRPMKITTIADLAYSNLEMANTLIFQGNRELATSFISKAYNQALSIDDNALIARACLAQSQLLPVGSESVEKALNQAVSFAAIAKNEELLTLCKLYQAQHSITVVQQMLTQSKSDVLTEKDAVRVQSALDVAQTASASSKKSPYNKAFAYRISGRAYILQKEWKNAETSLQEAAKIHTKERYLDEIGFDWYLLANVYSVSGKIDAAEQALQTALLYDRDAENSVGLIADYKALHTVYLKLNRVDDAQKALQRAESIETSRARIGIVP